MDAVGAGGQGGVLQQLLEGAAGDAAKVDAIGEADDGAAPRGVRDTKMRGEVAGVAG